MHFRWLQDWANHDGYFKERKSLLETDAQAAEGAGFSEEEATQGEDGRSEAAVFGHRQDHEEYQKVRTNTVV